MLRTLLAIGLVMNLASCCVIEALGGPAADGGPGLYPKPERVTTIHETGPPKPPPTDHTQNRPRHWWVRAWHIFLAEDLNTEGWDMLGFAATGAAVTGIYNWLWPGHKDPGVTYDNGGGCPSGYVSAPGGYMNVSPGAPPGCKPILGHAKKGVSLQFILKR